MSLVKIRRALISVSDKTGVDKLARVLEGFGTEILSTGGTARHLESCGIKIRSVDDFTGHPEMLDGRVKTLHPRVHGALLARRDLEDHMAQCEKLGIELIDMVVVNLYPFESTIAKPGVSLEDAIEQIDIGGPTMLRSAAKNYTAVTVVTSPDQYQGLIDRLNETRGSVDLKTRFDFARAVFARTSGYDRAIVEYLNGVEMP
jgi:phosphoribosylaminoimidazolecarboxamide formyltransferase/IMP cyclohydrolase